MKLISKTILYYLLISIPLLVIAGFLSYYLIRSEVLDSTEEALWKEKINVEKLLRSQSETKQFYLSSDSLSSVRPTSFHKDGFLFSDSIIFDKYENEELNYHLLKSYFNLNNQTYLITIAKPTLETDDLMESLFKAFTIILSFLILAFFTVNWLLSKTLWKPFYKTLDELNKYDLKNYSNSKFTSSSTKEFNQLNTVLNKMMEKIYSDFLLQKEFTENASHEMQTPLAVIKANISLLMQSPNLKEEEMGQLQAIDNTTKKLASLNKALLLLAKIENNQFKENSEISIKDTVNKVITHFEDLLTAKNITIENKFGSDLKVEMNPTLAEILITNLIQNAIRHNVNGGKIILELKNNLLTIANTGEALSINNDDLFVRFKKNDASKESIGLGLSIVKSITELNNFKINYTYQNSLHIFTIKFYL